VRFDGWGSVLCEGGGCGTRLYFVELGRISASSSSRSERNSDSASSSRVGDRVDTLGGSDCCGGDGGGCRSWEGIGDGGSVEIGLSACVVEELQSQPIITGLYEDRAWSRAVGAVNA
jgi:hypothetical protein